MNPKGSMQIDPFAVSAYSRLSLTACIGVVRSPPAPAVRRGTRELQESLPRGRVVRLLPQCLERQTGRGQPETVLRLLDQLPFDERIQQVVVGQSAARFDSQFIQSRRTPRALGPHNRGSVFYS